MKPLLITLTYFIFFISVIQAQHLEIIGDDTLSAEAADINDLIQLTDNRLVGVGTMKGKGDKTYAAIYFFSPKGVLIETKKFGAGGEGFNSITQAEYGTLILAGWTTTRGNGKMDGYLVHTTATGDLLRDTVMGTRENDCFQKVSMQNDGTIIVAGYKNTEANGRIWVVGLQKRKLLFDKEIGKGELTNIVGIVPTTDGKTILCGNSRENRGDVWTATLDKYGEVIYNRNLGGKLLESVNQVTSTPDGNILWSGETWTKGNGKGDAWLAEVTANGEPIADITRGTNNAEVGIAATKTTNQKYVFAVLDGKRSKTVELLDITGTSLSKTDILNAQNFQIRQILALKTEKYDAPNEFWLIGNLHSGKNETPNNIRLLRIRDDHTIAAKGGGADIECSEITFSDENSDKVLNPSERGALFLTVKNLGAAQGLDVRVHVAVRTSISGFSAWANVGSYVAGRQQKAIEIPVEATAQLSEGTATLDITVFANGQQVCTRTTMVRCVTGQAVRSAAGTTIGWKNNNESKTVRATTPQYPVRATVYSPTPKTNKDVKVYQNGSTLDDSKAGSIEIINDLRQGDVNIYTISTVLNLIPGINEIKLGITDAGNGSFKQTEILRIEYVPLQPTLHLVAIGPTYTDIKYNRKDATDIVELLKKQELQKGIYGRVVVHQMTTPEETSCNAIKGKFEELMNKAGSTDPDAIGETDILMVFYSGHGRLIRDELRLIPTDFKSNQEITTSVHFKNDIMAYLEKIRCKKVVLLDACHSGSSRAKSDVLNADDVNAALQSLSKFTTGWATFSSCDTNESSFEDSEWENGAFTKAFKEALTVGRASLKDGKVLTADANGDNLLSLKELADYTKLRVMDLVSRKHGTSSTQTPVFKGDLEDKLNFWITK